MSFASNMNETSNLEGNSAIYIDSGNKIEGDIVQIKLVGTLNYGSLQTKSDKENACLSAIGINNPSADRKALLDFYGGGINEGLCEWILDDDLFRAWRSDEDTEHPLIWTCKREEQGKTTLAIFLSQHLEQSSQNADDTRVLYYFCSRGHDTRGYTVSILKGLIWQLANGERSLIAEIQKQLEIQRESLFLHGHVGNLWSIFENMVNASQKKRIYCIIDGVDECEEQGKELEHFLIKLKLYSTEHNRRRAQKKSDASSNEASNSCSPTQMSSTSGAELRMMVLSNEDRSCVLKELRPFPKIFMPDLNMKQFIHDKLEKIADIYSESGLKRRKTTETISEALDKGDNNNFAWVNLVTDILMTMKPKEAKAYVKQIPETVEDIYVQTLLKVPSSQRPYVATILKWAALAARPLSTTEMIKAVKYSLKKSDFTKKSLNKALGVCHGMLQKHEREVKQGVTIKTIHLSHQSVEEFLVGEQSPLRENKKLRSFIVDKCDAHSELANTCIAYLQTTPYLEKSRRVRLDPGDKLGPGDLAFFSKHPFLEYAMVNWTLHAKQGTLEKTDYSVSFFKHGSPRRKLWWRSYWISLRHMLAWKWTTPGNFTLLHLAAFFDILPLALYVEQSGSVPELLNAVDTQGMKPISRATEKSSAAMVKFLLQRSEFDNEALCEAARTGDASIVKMLLEKRERILSSPVITRSPSSPASPSSPFHSIRSATLNSISDWSKKLDSARDKESAMASPGVKKYGRSTSETPLHIASTCGHDEVVEALLEAGEDPHKITDGGWTALHNAAWFGRVSVVELLVDAGADAKASTNDRLTPLHCSVKNAQPEVVQCLLAKKVAGVKIVDIEAEDNWRFSPLHMACKSGNLPIMEILLENGADIEMEMGPGWTPLIWACINGRFEVAELLLEKGANVNATWTCGYTETGAARELGPVGLAKAYRQERLASLVESFGGADTNRVVGEEANILPSTESVQEEYDVPEIEGIPIFGEESLEAVTSPELDFQEDSDEDNDEESEDSDDESLSRRPSESDVESVATNRRQSSVTPLGLGIHEEVDEDVNNNSTQHGGTPVTREANGDSAENLDRAINDDKKRILGQAQPSEIADSEREPHSEGTGQEMSEPGPMEDDGDNPVQDLPAERSDGKVKSPGSFSNVFGRLRPKNTTSRAGSTGKDKKDSFGTADEENLTILEDTDTFDQEPDEIVESPNQRETGMFQRFGPKRGWSWKNEKRADPAKTTSPRPK